MNASEIDRTATADTVPSRARRGSDLPLPAPAAAGAPTVLVTGATSGIGRATALDLARRGLWVFASGRNREALRALGDLATREELPLSPLRLDVTEPASIADAVDRIDRATAGRGIDILVNNAGFGVVAPLAEIHAEDLEAQFSTNVFGLVAVTQAFTRGMRERGRGRVINVGSLAGTFTMPMMGSYTATKYAVESISDAMRLELRAFGIRVSLIEPGMVSTDFSNRMTSSVGKYRDTESAYAPVLMRVEELEQRMAKTAIGTGPVARAIHHAATSRVPRSRYAVPRWVGWGVWLMRAMPSWLRDAAIRAFARLGPKTLERDARALGGAWAGAQTLSSQKGR